MKKISTTVSKVWLLLLFITVAATPLFSQKINRFRTNEMELIYFGKRYSYLMPHVAGTFHNALDFHKSHWSYNHQKTYVLLTDFEDDGHGGAVTMPVNTIILGISPFNFAFSIIPSSERFQWLFAHELTHVVLSEKPNKTDLFWRKLLFGKVSRDALVPSSAVWSYLTTPRWYAPRWFHEGIACYTETWTSGGLGRALGSYDEMYFRSIINENEPLYSVIGLETEGTTVDFQVGANAYLYGTRFVNYLAYTYGDDKVNQLYDRTDDSKAFYGAQFKKVFGKKVGDVWKDWMSFEQEFQKNNLRRIQDYPLTPLHLLTPEPMGSVSNVGYDARLNKIYAAFNHPGKISYVGELDLKTAKVRKLATLDSPLLYTVTFLAYDPLDRMVFVSENNSKYRSLAAIDVASGKKKILIERSRTGNLVYDTTNRCLWGVKHDNGYATLVKIAKPYQSVQPMYTCDFGRSLLDLAVSHDGQKLTATLTGVRGEQSIIMFNISELELGKKNYETVYQSEDNTLTQFRFSNDDQYLIGTSYFTGVSNIWRIALNDKRFELLSNDETGLFMPQQLSSDSIFVLKFRRDGMQPALMPVRVIEDANAITYLGNEVFDRNPVLESYSLKPASRVNIDSLKMEETSYRAIKNMSLTGAYPDITGFKKTAAIGYRLNWRDRVGLSNMNLFLGASPWSKQPSKQQIHAMFHWDLWLWKFNATYNKTDFYDLFGPTKRSRAGYSLGVNYKKTNAFKSPFKWSYGFEINHYGHLEVLPQFQNIASPIRNFQSISFDFGASKLRKSLGGVEDEMGYLWNLSAYSYLADSSFYPSLVSEQHIGWLIPGLRNTSFWLRSSIGQAFGKESSSFSNFYFGGFRNNYVDWQPADQYRKVLAFPGVDIDQIQAHNFVKTMAEFNLKPLRLKNIGFTWLYPSYLKSSIFGTHLLANPTSLKNTRNYFNAGLQIDLELVLFSYLKTTWSAGYARKFEKSLLPSQQWMFSIKLLGN